MLARQPPAPVHMLTLTIYTTTSQRPAKKNEHTTTSPTSTTNHVTPGRPTIRCWLFKRAQRRKLFFSHLIDDLDLSAKPIRCKNEKCSRIGCMQGGFRQASQAAWQAAGDRSRRRRPRHHRPRKNVNGRPPPPCICNKAAAVAAPPIASFSLVVRRSPARLPAHAPAAALADIDRPADRPSGRALASPVSQRARQVANNNI